MSYLSLGLNLPAQFAVDPWFFMKRAVAHHVASASSAPSDNSQQDVYEGLLINLRKSSKLITWNSTSTVQSEVSGKTSIKSSTCDSPPAPRKRPVCRQRFPEILISDEDFTLAMACADQVNSKSTPINPTAFIPLTEEQSENFHIFNELLAEHNVSAISTPSLLTSKLPSMTLNSSRATKRSLSNSELSTTCAPSSKKSKPTLHWTEILDNLMTASDWEEAEEELQKQADQNDPTSLKKTVSFIPLTEDESENFHIFNDLLAEHQVSSISTPSFSTSEIPSITPKTPRETKRSLSKSRLFTPSSDWEEAEEESQKEADQMKSIEFTPLTSVESSNFDIYNELVLEHQVSETLKSSASTLATITSSQSTSTKTLSSKSQPLKPCLENFKDIKRQLHWSEILDNLMIDEDREEADESSLPLCPERSFTLDMIYSIPSSYSSAENTNSLPTPVEELKDPFGLIFQTHPNSYYHSDIMSMKIVKSSLEENDDFTIDLSFNIEKSFSNFDFDFENSFC